MRIALPRKVTFTKENLACAGLFFFLIKSPVRTLLSFLLRLPGTFNTWISIVLMFIPLFMIPFVGGKKRKVIDSIAVWIGVCMVVVTTFMFHPEYGKWLFEGEFNVGLAIFRPDQAIYIYLFLRLIDDPKRVLKVMKWAGFILLAYCLYKYVEAEFITGYWAGTGVSRGAEGEYNLGFGYEALFVFVIFAVLGRKENRWFYMAACICFVLILLAGSRGPLVGVAFLMLVFLLEAIKHRPMLVRFLFTSLFLLTAILVIANFNAIILGMGMFLQKMGVSSRTVLKMASGSFMDDSGRGRLYEIALDLIRNGGPLGNGIYGDRFVIAQKTSMWIGYCHNVALEILVDFGWLLGGTMLIMMIRRILIILCSEDNEWRTLFLIFVSTASQLILSGSFWYTQSFWACLAVAMSWREYDRRKRKGIPQSGGSFEYEK